MITESDLMKIKRKIESLKTTLAVKENDRQRLSDEIGEHVSFKSMSDIPKIIDGLKNDLGALQERSQKLHDKINELLEGVR